jgi:hypothetical protein
MTATAMPEVRVSERAGARFTLRLTLRVVGEPYRFSSAGR